MHARLRRYVDQTPVSGAGTEVPLLDATVTLPSWRRSPGVAWGANPALAIVGIDPHSGR